MSRQDQSINNKFGAGIIEEEMDQVHDRASLIAEEEEEEEDRISNLPDDIIHCILSFLDMKYAVQTSTLSKKWKHIWTSMPHLNLNSETFPTLPHFANFVKHALSHRNHLTEVSALELKFTGVATQFSVKSIVKYAYSHNVKQMSMVWLRFKGEVLKFPQCLFSSHTLKHLTLMSIPHYYYPCGQSVPKSAWDFPVLETLNLSNLQLGDDGHKSLNLFSKCVNLKDLTLDGCSMFGLDIFTVSAPQLSSLTITDHDFFPKLFNIVAPQLENLTASINCRKPECVNFLQLSTEGLNSLEKVNLSLLRYGYHMKRNVPQILNLFKKLHGAKFLILDRDIIKGLSSCVDELLHEPCPFNNLKCLKQKDCKERIPTQLRNYFLESSPNATFIMDSPQVAWKRSREEVYKGTRVNKLEEKKSILQAKMKMIEEVIAQEKEMIEALDLQLEKFRSQIRLMVVAGGNPDYKLMPSILLHSIKSIMQLTPEILRVDVKLLLIGFCQEMKSKLSTHIHASRWAEIEMELGITDNVHS